MLGLLSITFPIFALIGLGYAVTARGIFERQDMRSLGRFVLQLALPALVFSAVSSRDLGQIVNGGYLFAYLAGSLLTAGIGALALARVQGLDRPGLVLCVMGMSCANSGFIGYPILLLTFPAIAGVALALNMMVENLVMIPMILAALELTTVSQGAHRGAVLRRTVGRLIRQPLMLALAAGLLVALLGLHLPAALTRTVGILAGASAALSLSVIGGSLVDRPRGEGTGLAAAVAAGKLVLHPLMVAAMLWFGARIGLPVAEPLHTAAILMAAVPMMGIYPVLAQAHGREGLASLSLLYSVVAAFGSLTLALALLH